jgi:chitodextrinase
LSAVGGRSRATLYWSASTDSGGSGLAGYELFRSSSPSGPWTQVATTTGTTFVDKSATRGTYWYFVRAYDRAGNRSAASPTATATVS